MRNRILTIAVLAIAYLLSGCRNGTSRHTAAVTSGGNEFRGARLIQYYGCGSCHIIPGISGAAGLVGPPPLSGIASRMYIAGVLQNTRKT